MFNNRQLIVSIPGPFPVMNLGTLRVSLIARGISRIDSSMFENIFAEILEEGGMKVRLSKNRGRKEKAIILAGKLKPNPLMKGLLFQAILTDTFTSNVHWYITLMTPSIQEMQEKYYLIYRKLFM